MSIHHLRRDTAASPVWLLGACHCAHGPVHLLKPLLRPSLGRVPRGGRTSGLGTRGRLGRHMLLVSWNTEPHTVSHWPPPILARKQGLCFCIGVPGALGLLPLGAQSLASEALCAGLSSSWPWEPHVCPSAKLRLSDSAFTAQNGPWQEHVQTWAYLLPGGRW